MSVWSTTICSCNFGQNSNKTTQLCSKYGVAWQNTVRLDNKYVYHCPPRIHVPFWWNKHNCYWYLYHLQPYTVVILVKISKTTQIPSEIRVGLVEYGEVGQKYAFDCPPRNGVPFSRSSNEFSLVSVWFITTHSAIWELYNNMLNVWDGATILSQTRTLNHTDCYVDLVQLATTRASWTRDP